MIRNMRTSTRRRVVAGVVAIAAVAGIGALTAPVAQSAGGPNSGTVVTGPDAGPDVAKKDRWAVIAADGTFTARASSRRRRSVPVRTR